MAIESNLSADQAAQRLGVTRARVRALAQAGLLDARKLGGRWLIAQESVEQRASQAAHRGRPLDSRNAWALLWLDSDDQALQQLGASWLSVWARSRARQRFRRERWEALAPALRRRARVQWFRAHPSDLQRLAAEPELVLTGVSAAAGHGIDVVAPGTLEAYVREGELGRLAEQYLLAPSPNPNVLLHVTPQPWPFPPGHTVAPPVVVALDLLDSGEPRSQRAARQFLAERTNG